jgi:hydrogenase expression/formation protein HypE
MADEALAGKDKTVRAWKEGLRVEDLRKIAISMAAEAAAAGVSIVAADTKVVEKGHGDGVFINTTGIGFLEDGPGVGSERIQPGDLILINGESFRHFTTTPSGAKKLRHRTGGKGKPLPRRGMVFLKTLSGGTRELSDITATQFPRIC